MSEVPINQCSGVNDIYEYNELHLDSAARDQGRGNQRFPPHPHPFTDIWSLQGTTTNPSSCSSPPSATSWESNWSPPR